MADTGPKRLTDAGVITAAVSAGISLLGYSYRSSFGNAEVNLYGLDPTYQLATWCIVLGIIGFLVGLILLVVGITQRPS